MNTTIVLAQALGIICTVTGVSMLVNKKGVASAINELAKNEGLLWLFGFIALLVGAPIVALNNDWSSGLELCITIMGWLAVLKDVVILVFPESTVSMYKQASRSGVLAVAGLAVLFLGLALIYAGFV